MPPIQPEPRWVSAFIDVPAANYRRSMEFWAQVTGSAISAARGETGEFVSLLPPDGATDHLRLQRVGDRVPRLHLDLHVVDPRAAAEQAVARGARLIADRGYQVLASPGGHPFCFVSAHPSRPATPTRWPDGTSSLVDQVCLDLPADQAESEGEFWSWLTGWTSEPGRFEEFAGLIPPPGIRVRLLLQHLDEATGGVRSHLDVSTSDRDAECGRHLEAGAVLVAEQGHWTVMRDPAGMTYCLTDRNPVSGKLPALT